MPIPHNLREKINEFGEDIQAILLSLNNTENSNLMDNLQAHLTLIDEIQKNYENWNFIAAEDDHFATIATDILLPSGIRESAEKVSNEIETARNAYGKHIEEEAPEKLVIESSLYTNILREFSNPFNLSDSALSTATKLFKAVTKEIDTSSLSPELMACYIDLTTTLNKCISSLQTEKTAELPAIKQTIAKLTARLDETNQFFNLLNGLIDLLDQPIAAKPNQKFMPTPASLSNQVTQLLNGLKTITNLDEPQISLRKSLWAIELEELLNSPNFETLVNRSSIFSQISSDESIDEPIKQMARDISMQLTLPKSFKPSSSDSLDKKFIMRDINQLAVLFDSLAKAKKNSPEILMKCSKISNLMLEYHYNLNKISPSKSQLLELKNKIAEINNVENDHTVSIISRSEQLLGLLLKFGIKKINGVKRDHEMFTRDQSNIDFKKTTITSSETETTPMDVVNSQISNAN